MLLVVLDDVGYAQLGCFGSDIETPTFDRLAANGLRYANFHTTALCSPTRACLLTGRNHHACGMGRVVDLATGFPGYDARIPRSCALLPAMLTPHGYAAYAVGKWHLTPEDEEHLGSRRDRWPLGRGFERWYGFFAGETHQFVPVPRARQPLRRSAGHVRGRLPPDRGPGRPRRSSSSRTFATSTSTSRGCSTSLPARATRRTRRPPTGSSATAAASTAAGTCGATKRWRGRRRPGCCPSTPSCHRDPSGYRRGTTSTTTNAVSTRATWRRSPRSSSHADRAGRSRRRPAREIGELDNTIVIVLSDNGASSEGGPTGSLNDGRRVERAASNGGRSARSHRRHRRAPAAQQLSVGLDGRGQHAVPTVEARDARGRRRRPADRALARGHPGARRGADAVRARHRRRAHDPRTRGRAVPDGRRRGRAEAARRREPAPTASTAPRRPNGTRCSTPRCSAAGRCTRTGGRRSSITTSSSTSRVSTARRGSCTTCAPIRPNATTSPRPIRNGWPRWSTAGGPRPRRNEVLPLDNRPFSEFVLERRSSVARAAAVRLLARSRTGAGERRRQHPQPSAHGRARTCTRTAEPVEGVLVSQGSVLGGWSFHVVDGRLCYVHNLAGWRVYRVDGPMPSSLLAGRAHARRPVRPTRCRAVGRRRGDR